MTSETNFKARISILWEGIKSYFNISNDLEPQDLAEQSIRSGVSFKGSQLLVLIFAIFIASLGLNTNSIPVIIGAMLISPLMGPIIGIGLGIGIKDFTLVKNGAKNISMAIIGSLAASAIYFLISPQYEGSSQLLARTSPSIYDVFVALFGGAAGIVSIACKNKGQVMPGVAIATSLMPPLCTAGYGLATWQATFFFGALYLFFTNMVFILFASWIGVKLMGYKAKVYENEARAKRVQRIVYSIVVATICISGYLTVVMIQNNIFMAKAAEFVDTEMVFPNTQVLSHKEYVSNGKKYIDVTLIGAALPKDSLKLAMINKMDSVGLGSAILNIRQGFSFSNADYTASAEAGSEEVYRLMQNALSQKEEEIDSLKNIINMQMEFSQEGQRLAPELKVVFPSIRDVALANMVASEVSDGKSDTLYVMFANTPRGMTLAERKKLTEYLEVRLQKKPINVILNPANFPWPSTK